MLAYLDALCTALLSRDVETVARLMGHPLALALPRAVRDEAASVMAGAVRPFGAPLHALRLYHQTKHLLGVSHDPASRTHTAGRGGARPQIPVQIELPLPARVA